MDPAGTMWTASIGARRFGDWSGAGRPLVDVLNEAKTVLHEAKKAIAEEKSEIAIRRGPVTCVRGEEFSFRDDSNVPCRTLEVPKSDLLPVDLEHLAYGRIVEQTARRSFDGSRVWTTRLLPVTWDTFAQTNVQMNPQWVAPILRELIRNEHERTGRPFEKEDAVVFAQPHDEAKSYGLRRIFGGTEGIVDSEPRDGRVDVRVRTSDCGTILVREVPVGVLRFKDAP